MKKNNDNGMITDFGEKIGGARKDLWAGRGLEMEDLHGMNDAERASYIKKDSIWPKPDYKAMHGSGIPREVCWFIKAVRDKAPVRPAAGNKDAEHEQERYILFMSGLRDAAMACRTEADIRAMATFFQDNGYCQKKSSYIYAPYEPTEKAGPYLDNKLFKTVQTGKDFRSLSMEVYKKEFLFTEEEKMLKHFRFEEYSDSMKPLTPGDQGKMLAVRRPGGTYYFYPEKGIDITNLKEGTWFVARGSRVIASGLRDEEECRAFALGLERMKQEEEKAQKKCAEGKGALRPPQLAHIERTGGRDYRHGEDITGQAYLDSFGFRGGEFGNWTNQKDRQASLNMGYDALKDLARAVNISDKDVALGGGLAIAFGARGKGSALAHYEPMREVVNLTKMRGAGSLGHEWVHALDDFAGKKLGVQDKKGGRMLSECFTQWKHAGVVPESFTALMDAIMYRTVTGADAVRLYRDELDRTTAEFRSWLGSASRRGAAPEAEARRQALIGAVIDEAKASYGYKFTSVEDGKRGPVLVYDKTPSPAYQAFIDFQKAQGDENPASLRNREHANAARHRIGALADMIEHHADGLKGRKVDTKFFSDAKYIDKAYSKTGHGYWSSGCELLARAGAAYIKDKCRTLGIRNDYLSGHADCPPVEGPDGSLHYISPQGVEREAVNKAFDAFFGELRGMGLLHENMAAL